jgi:hypothetical protein
MSDAAPFSRLVTLACHDLRTPLATVNGFAKTLLRGGELAEREQHFVGLIDTAGGQLSDLLDLLGLAARIESGSYEPALREADTLELARSDDERIGAGGSGETIETDAPAVARSLDCLAVAALRHGDVESVEWTVRGRDLALAPVNAAASGVVTGDEPKDLGALVARLAIERLGGSLAIDGEQLRVRL